MFVNWAVSFLRTVGRTASLHITSGSYFRASSYNMVSSFWGFNTWLRSTFMDVFSAIYCIY